MSLCVSFVSLCVLSWGNVVSAIVSLCVARWARGASCPQRSGLGRLVMRVSGAVVLAVVPLCVDNYLSLWITVVSLCVDNWSERSDAGSVRQ